MAARSDDRTPAAEAGRVASQARPVAASVDGPRFRALFRDALHLLEQHVDTLNAINVFPVPDGDTGTNMRLSLGAAVEAMPEAGAISEVAAALGHAALMGARGNSGVILSQVLRGLAAGLEGHREADGPALAAALDRGAEAALHALSEPKEGTILTVAREAASGARGAGDGSVDAALAGAVLAANDAVARTPELLPVLKEAGVVDAGGLGLALILQGMLHSLRGEPIEAELPPMTVRAAWRTEAASLHESGAAGESGYCTEFVVTGQGLDVAVARGRLDQMGTSVLVVGGDGLVRVHIHTTEPDDALAYGRELGELSQIKIDNLEAQISDFFGVAPAEPITQGLDVVAVAAGDGIEAAFRGLGVAHIVPGGQTMNPSAAEILEAIGQCVAERVVVLPNNKNVVATARVAAERSSKQVAVLPSRTIPQGMAAVLALNADEPFEANVEAMERALASVRSAEVTRAVRSTVVDGRQVETGQAIGLVEGNLEVVEEGVDDAVRGCVDRLMSAAEAPSLLTVYYGEEVREADAELLAQELRAEFAGIEIELVPGGQPHYPYILSLE
jgi:DAK2 domain fusion protein YloV